MRKFVMIIAVLLMFGLTSVSAGDNYFDLPPGAGGGTEEPEEPNDPPVPDEPEEPEDITCPPHFAVVDGECEELPPTMTWCTYEDGVEECYVFVIGSADVYYDMSYGESTTFVEIPGTFGTWDDFASWVTGVIMDVSGGPSVPVYWQDPFN